MRVREIAASLRKVANLNVGDEVTLKYFTYAYPAGLEREDMIAGIGTLIPKGSPAIIDRIEGDHAILEIKFKGKTLVAAVKLSNLELDTFFSR